MTPKPRKLSGGQGGAPGPRERRDLQRGTPVGFPLRKRGEQIEVLVDPTGAIGTDPARGLFVRTGGGLGVESGSPYGLVVVLGDGLELVSGEIRPRFSSSVKMNAKKQLIATPSTLEVTDPDDGSAFAKLERKANVAVVEAIDVRVVALEARPSKLIVPFHSLSNSQATWTNMPAAATLLAGHHRHVVRADLTGYTQCRIGINKMGTAGVAGAKFILRYRTTFSTAAADYSDIGTSEVSGAIDATDTYVSSAWIDLAAGAKADVFLAVVGEGGDGVVDPQYGSIVMEVR